jgi:opacity protein-like surface antigen
MDMKRVSLVYVCLGLFFTLISTINLAQNHQQFYAGATAGFANPNELHETWHNIYKPQTADLSYEMSNGFLAGAKFGFVPAALNRILAVELEYNYSKIEFSTLMTPGFVAGDSTITGFGQDMNDSHTTFHSVSLNIIARYPEGKAHPYIGFGPGMTYTEISFNEPDLFGESGNDTGFSYQVIFGADFDITSKITLGLAYKYFEVNPVQTWANGTHSHYDPRLHNYVLDVKYKF